jgi:hypothetical protein
MPATAILELVSTETSTAQGPSAAVLYDTVNSVITVTVTVSLLSGQPNVIVAPFSMPRGSWTVLWNLIPGSGVTSAIFPDTDGIVVPMDQQPPLPMNVRVGASQRNSDTEWQIQLTNFVTTVNSFNYLVTVIPSDVSANALPPFTHDPTIAVTQDPMT